MSEEDDFSRVSAPTALTTRMDLDTLQRELQSLRAELQTYHWITQSATQHAAAASAMSTIDDKGDALVEIMMSEHDDARGDERNSGRRRMVAKMRTFIRSAEQIHGSIAVVNARDELIAALQRNVYLLNKRA